MESVRTQDVSVNDLRWTIEYRPDLCTMCGSCVAACTFNAIEVGMMRRSITLSRKAFPDPTQEHSARPVIMQKASIPSAWSRRASGRSPKRRASGARGIE